MNLYTINSYGGSLLLGARQAGYPAVYSMEDSGFGSEMQEKNFSGTRHFAKKPWPAIPPGEMIIAHPPCSAASTMNPVKATKGANSAAFACTRHVLDYAIANAAHTVAIESVVPACDMARACHDEYAKKGGWNLFRVFQNAEDFGVPQHRIRFWAIFSRAEMFTADWKPRRVRLSSILGAPGAVSECHERMLAQQFAMMTANGVDAHACFSGKNGYGLVRNMLKKLKKSEAAVHPTRFAVSTPYLLDPNGSSPCLLGGCAWFAPDASARFGARPLTGGEYNLIAGFPVDYPIWPERQRCTFLSKGVAPPVAAWVVKSCMEGGSDVTCRPNGILDLT